MSELSERELELYMHDLIEGYIAKNPSRIQVVLAASMSGQQKAIDKERNINMRLQTALLSSISLLRDSRVSALMKKALQRQVLRAIPEAGGCMLEEEFREFCEAEQPMMED